MTKKILNLIRSSQGFFSCKIAKELKISQDLVNLYKEELEKRGYLKISSFTSCQKGKCSSCSLCSSKSLNSISTLEITKKGLALLDN